MNPPTTTPRDLSLRVALSALLALFLVSNWLPAPWLWGLNHGLWLPLPLRWGLPLIALLVIWTPAADRFGTWLAGGVDAGLLGRRAVAYGVVPVLGALGFWFFRDSLHLLGDGQTLAIMIDRGDAFHGFDFTTYSLVARLYQMMGSEGKPAAYDVFAVVSALSGAAYLAAAAWSARRLASGGAGRILLYFLLVFSATTLLFFGYAEVYAPLTVALLVFVTNTVSYLQGRGSLWAAAIAWAAALFFHLNALFLFPLLAALLFLKPDEDDAPFVSRLITMLWPPVVALVLAGGTFMAWGYGLEQWRQDFGGAGEGIFVPMSGRDGLLGGFHLKDVLNLLLLIVPVPLALLVSASVRGISRDRADVLLGMGPVWLFLLVLTVHMKLGIVRDWDLFAPHLVLVTVTAWCAVSREDLKPWAVGASVAVALVLVAPWWMVNASPQRALTRLEDVTTDLDAYPRGLIHEQMAAYHLAAGDHDETARNYRRAGEVCPGNPRFSAIYGTYMFNMKDLDEALAAYGRALEADSTYVYALQMSLTVGVMRKDQAIVLDMARRLERLDRQTPDIAQAHGIAAEQLGHPREAIVAYQRGAAMDPARLGLLGRAGELTMEVKEYAEAETIFRKLRTLRPEWSGLALSLADAIWADYLKRPDARPVNETRARLTEAVALIDFFIEAPEPPKNNLDPLYAKRNEILAAAESLAGQE